MKRLGFLTPIPILVLAGCVAVGPDVGSGSGPGGKADHGDDTGCGEPPASEVELKVTIDPGSIEAALAALDLDEADAEHRAVTYYDTPELALYESGLILRAREKLDDDDDSTVKVRPLLAEEMWEVEPDFFDEDGFKCEIDRTPSREVSSCSLKVDQDEGEITEVAAGDRDVDRLFSSEQEDLLATFGPTDFDFADAVALGPVDTRRWKIEVDEVPARLTVEIWAMPDGTDLMELSIKVDAEESAAAMEALLDHVDALGLPLDEAQSTKTGRVLEFFAAPAEDGVAE